MPKINPRYIDSKKRMEYLDLLWTSIAQLRTRDEVKNFFKDLLSEGETIMLARRIEVAKRLLEGASYDEIIAELKVGRDTIGRVQRWLVGGFGGYKKAIDRFKQEMNRRLKSIDRYTPQPYSFEWLKQKYPLHFLLFSLFDNSQKFNKSQKKVK